MARGPGTGIVPQAQEHRSFPIALCSGTSDGAYVIRGSINIQCSNLSKQTRSAGFLKWKPLAQAPKLDRGDHLRKLGTSASADLPSHLISM